MSKISSGCPFNSFGPCMEEKCKFFLHAKNLNSYCAILASHAEAISANTSLTGFTLLLNLFREIANIPEDELVQFHQFALHESFLSDLKRICSTQSVDVVTREKSLACFDKVRRMLAIVCEDDNENMDG